MPGAFMNPTIATGIFDSQYQATPLFDESAWTRAHNNWQRRSMQAAFDHVGWCHLWPRSSFMGDTAQVPGTFGTGADGGDYFEPPNFLGSGTQSVKFIKGVTYDANGAVLANAIVQGFVTATDTFVGEVTSNTDGTYILPTNNPSSAQHYVVAYKAGSPDVAGTTVNTLLPTNIDGT